MYVCACGCVCVCQRLERKGVEAWYSMLNTIDTKLVITNLLLNVCWVYYVRLYVVYFSPICLSCSFSCFLACYVRRSIRHFFFLLVASRPCYWFFFFFFFFRMWLFMYPFGAYHIAHAKCFLSCHFIMGRSNTDRRQLNFTFEFMYRCN